MESAPIYVVRNEPLPGYEWHCDALGAHFPTSQEVDFPAGERPELADAAAIVLTGSSAGVYETAKHPWISEQEDLIRDAVAREIPLLGVCFGHQIVNSALGGTVECVGMWAGLVEADFTEDPLFEGVNLVVPTIHEDAVTDIGDGLEVIATTDAVDVFGTRHQTAPVWTIQFHPEITANHRDQIADHAEWASTPFSFADVTAERVFTNFTRLVDGQAPLTQD